MDERTTPLLQKLLNKNENYSQSRNISGPADLTEINQLIVINRLNTR